jgi:hypothetical protein
MEPALRIAGSAFYFGVRVVFVVERIPKPWLTEPDCAEWLRIYGKASFLGHGSVRVATTDWPLDPCPFFTR